MQWFAVQVAPQHEKKIAAVLEYKGYQLFLPMHTVRHKWSDRTKVLEQPLFPHYVFCRIQQTAMRPVIATPGVVRIVGFGGKPCPVREEEIFAIQRIVDAGLEAIPVAQPRVGDRIEVQEGPLKGIMGIVTRINNRNHLVISIATIMKSIAVVIDGQMVKALSKAA